MRRLVNVWKRSKDVGRRLVRKVKYHGREVSLRVEKWRRKDNSRS